MDQKAAKSQLKKFLKLMQDTDVQVLRVLVFGSHAKGFATKLSDLDVCLVFSKKVKNADEVAASLRYKLGRMNLNIDLSSVYDSEMRENKLSSFINELKVSAILAEDFLKDTPKNIDA